MSIGSKLQRPQPFDLRFHYNRSQSAPRFFSAPAAAGCGVNTPGHWIVARIERNLE